MSRINEKFFSILLFCVVCVYSLYLINKSISPQLIYAKKVSRNIKDTFVFINKAPRRIPNDIPKLITEYRVLKRTLGL